MCCYCRENKATSLDHVTPRSRGGSNLRSNLLPACRSCQESKGNRIDWYDWFKEQPFFNQDAADLILEHTQNKRILELDNDRAEHRTKISTDSCSLRVLQNESPSTGKDLFATA
ncbi:MAG: HNH endonuclease [bacterium]